METFDKFEIIGKEIYVISEIDPYYKKRGKIIEVLNGAFYNLVVLFPNEKTQLYRNSEVRIIEPVTVPEDRLELSSIGG